MSPIDLEQKKKRSKKRCFFVGIRWGQKKLPHPGWKITFFSKNRFYSDQKKAENDKILHILIFEKTKKTRFFQKKRVFCFDWLEKTIFTCNCWPPGRATFQKKSVFWPFFSLNLSLTMRKTRFFRPCGPGSSKIFRNFRKKK